MDSGAPIHDSGEQVRGRSLGDLEVTVELYGVRSWTHPIDEEHRAGSPYGPRTGPISGRPGFHQGQDIPCERGEPVYAVADGEVITSRRSKSAGKYIEIRHDSEDHTVVTQYMHLSRRKVRAGRKVRKGKKIGRCGSTGNSTGAHLHFAVVVDGSHRPPFAFVNRPPTRREARRADRESDSSS